MNIYIYDSNYTFKNFQIIVFIQKKKEQQQQQNSYNGFYNCFLSADLDEDDDSSSSILVACFADDVLSIDLLDCDISLSTDSGCGLFTVCFCC